MLLGTPVRQGNILQKIVREMKKMEMKMELRFMVLGSYSSQNQPHISGHPVTQRTFFSADFRPTSYMRETHTTAALTCQRSCWSVRCHWMPPSCNPWERQAGKLLETPGPRLSSSAQAVCSTLVKPWLKTRCAADTHTSERLSSRTEPDLSNRSHSLSCSAPLCPVMSRTGFRGLCGHSLCGDLVRWESSANGHYR